MQIKNTDYEVTSEADTNTITFKGSLRLNGPYEYTPITQLLMNAAEVNDTITLDLRELESLNSSGISMLSKFVIKVRQQKSSHIIVQASREFPWQAKSLKNLQRLMPSLKLELE